MNITLPKAIHAEYNDIKPYQRRLLTDTCCQIGSDRFEIAEGFWWNGMSAPKITWSIIGSPFTGLTYIPVLWHDIFYGTQYFTQERCDNILLQMNKIKGVGIVKREVIDITLRALGGIAYNKQTDEQIAGCAKHLYINGKQFIP